MLYKRWKTIEESDSYKRSPSELDGRYTDKAIERPSKDDSQVQSLSHFMLLMNENKSVVNDKEKREQRFTQTSDTELKNLNL